MDKPNVFNLYLYNFWTNRTNNLYLYNLWTNRMYNIYLNNLWTNQLIYLYLYYLWMNWMFDLYLYNLWTNRIFILYLYNLWTNRMFDLVPSFSLFWNEQLRCSQIWNDNLREGFKQYFIGLNQIIFLKNRVIKIGYIKKEV